MAAEQEPAMNHFRSTHRNGKGDAEEHGEKQPLQRHFEEFSVLLRAEAEKVGILSGFPASIRGRLIFVPKDNLNTDGIYAGQYTYRENMTPEMMAQVVFDNYDPQLAPRESCRLRAAYRAAY